MSHFKDKHGALHWLDDDELLNLLPEGSILITDEEADLIRNPPETNEQRRTRIKGELDALERDALMPRGARETFIALCEQQGQLANLSKEQLYAVNPFYKGLIDRDNEAKALRAQL